MSYGPGVTGCVTNAKLSGHPLIERRLSVASSPSPTNEANQAAVAQRLRVEAEQAAKRADAVKQQVRLAKTILKRTRQLAKASKKAAKQARKKAKAAQAALRVRIRKSPASRVTAPRPAKGSVKSSRSKPEAKPTKPKAKKPKASHPSKPSRRGAVAPPPKPTAESAPEKLPRSAAEAAQSVIQRLAGALPGLKSTLRDHADQEPGK